MTERTAHVIACDDIRREVGGKFILIGMYTGSIVIHADEFATPQLVFLFLITTELDDPYQALACEVTLPGAETLRQEIPVINRPADVQLRKLGARRRVHRVPMFVRGPILRQGRIEAKIVHEKGELPAIGMPFIIRALDHPTAAPAAS
jgi:hypothetical protein